MVGSLAKKGVFDYRCAGRKTGGSKSYKIIGDMKKERSYDEVKRLAPDRDRWRTESRNLL